MSGNHGARRVLRGLLVLAGCCAPLHTLHAAQRVTSAKVTAPGKSSVAAKGPAAPSARVGNHRLPPSAVAPRGTAVKAAQAAARQAQQTQSSRGKVLRHAIIERPAPSRLALTRILQKPTLQTPGFQTPDVSPSRPERGSRFLDSSSAPDKRARATAARDEQLAAKWIPESTVLPQLSQPLDLRLRNDRNAPLLAANNTGTSAGASAPTPALLSGYAQMQLLLRTAAERSASIRDAQAAVRASEHDVKEASGARLPQFSMDVTSRYSRGAGDNETASQRGAPYYSIVGTMPLYDFGRISGIVDSRSASRRAADARLDNALESLALDTATAALELGRYRQAVTTTEAYLRNVNRLAEMLVAITREDPGRSGELTQARSRVLQAQVTLETLNGKAREAGIALQRLIGPVELPIDALIGAFEQIPPLEGLLQALPAQPALRQLDAEREAQANMAKSLASARWPQLSATVSRSPVAPGVVNGYGSYAGLTVNMPLFRGFSDVAAQRAAEERANGAGERRQQGEVDITSRLRTLHESATALLGRVPEFVGLLRESDQVRRGFFEQWYQMGRRSLFELLAAESEHYSLLSAHLNTLYDGLETCARLRGEAGALASWLGMFANERSVRERGQ